MSLLKRAGPLLTGLLLAAAALLVPLGSPNDPLRHDLLDATHLPFFAALTLFLYTTNPLGLVMPGQRRGGAALLAALIAMATEIVQPLTGREESLTDLFYGSGGILLAWLLLRWAPRFAGWRFLLWIALAGLLSLQVLAGPWRHWQADRWRRAHFPLLADFESPAEMVLWGNPQVGRAFTRNLTLRRSSLQAARGKCSLHLTAQSANRFGVYFRQDGADWSAFDVLAFDVFNAGARFDLAVSIDDGGPGGVARDRPAALLAIPPGWTHCRLPLRATSSDPKARSLDLRRVSTLGLMAYPAAGMGADYFLDAFRLEVQ